MDGLPRCLAASPASAERSSICPSGPHRCVLQICRHDRRRHERRVRADEAVAVCGIVRLLDGLRKALLHTTVSEVFAPFEDQVLAFDAGAAVHYADIVGGRDRLGLPIDGFDAQIAAICRAHGATLATRNLKDFCHTDVNLIDPWQHA